MLFVEPVDGRAYVFQVLSDAILGRPGNYREFSEPAKVYLPAIRQCPFDRLQDRFQGFPGLCCADTCLPDDGGY